MAESSEPLRRVAIVIDAVGSSANGLTSGRIAELTALPIPTVHRTLRNLVSIGYVEHDGPGTPYRLGQRLLRLIQPKIGLDDITAIAAPILERLANKLGTVTGMSTYVPGTGFDPVMEVLPQSRSQSLVLVGHGFPLHCTASGKVYLSRMDQAELDAVIAKGLQKCRPATITDPDELRLHLGEVRRQGHAMSRDECDPGIYSVSVPVDLSDHNLLFTVGTVGLKQALFADRTEEEVIRLVKLTAQELIARLGGMDIAPQRRKRVSKQIRSPNSSLS